VKGIVRPFKCRGVTRLIRSGIRGASKIKLKKVNKKRTVTVRRVIIFFEYLKASIADLFTMLSSTVQNSEGRGGGNSGDSFADPCQEFEEGF
jgi:hypothetical protein